MEHSLGVSLVAFILDETIAFPELDVLVVGITQLLWRVLAPLLKDAHFFVKGALHDLALHLFLESRDIFLTLGDFTVIEEAFWDKIFFSLSIGLFIKSVRDLLTGFAATMPFLLLFDPLGKASLVWFFCIFVFDHVLVLAWFAK